MMSGKKKFTPEIMFSGIQLGVKFGHIIPPFDIIFLENRLLKLGYDLEKLMSTSSATATPGKLRLATKEDLEVSYNNDKQVLTIKGSHPEKIVKSFRDLFDSITELASPIKLKVDFFETVISAIVNASKNPLTVFSKGENMVRAKEFETLFGQKVSPFGFRLAPSNTEIDNPNWFEYRIEPFILQPSLAYLSAYIYRNQNMKQVIEAFSSFTELTTNLVTLIED
jgi:hypothetical protein